MAVTPLTRYLADGNVPAENHWIENRIRPIALGRNSWLFAGSLRAGQRAAALMNLIGSAKMNGLDPHAYLKGYWSDCRHIRPAASRSRCRIGGKQHPCTEQLTAVKKGWPDAYAKAAQASLEAFAASPWGAQYLSIVKCWKSAWTQTIPFFALPPQVHRMTYTASAIEILHMQLRHVPKTHGRGGYDADLTSQTPRKASRRRDDDSCSPLGLRASIPVGGNSPLTRQGACQHGNDSSKSTGDGLTKYGPFRRARPRRSKLARAGRRLQSQKKPDTPSIFDRCWTVVGTPCQTHHTHRIHQMPPAVASSCSSCLPADVAGAQSPRRRALLRRAIA